jgi:hypothetical protein
VLTTSGKISFFRIIAYSFLSTILLLGFLEIAIRIVYPAIEPTGTSYNLVADSVYGSSAGLRPLASGLSGGKPFSVDALGFWKYAAKSDSLQESWLLLGDSVTMGIGVEPDSTFAGRLSNLYPSRYIINPSWIGYSSSDYVNITRSLLFKHQLSNRLMLPIRRVTLFWTLNDVYSHCNVGLPPGQVVRNYGSWITKWMREHYLTYHWLKYLLLDRSKAYFQFDAQFYQRGDSCFTAALEDLKNIKQMCINAGVQFQVILLPYEYQIRQTDSTAYRPQTLISQELDSLHIQWYDLTPRFRDLPGNHRNLYLFGDGIHLSSLGHAEVSRYVQEITYPLSH